MTDFRIVNNVSTGFLRWADRLIDTHVVDDVAQAAITRTKGITNPLHILSFGELNRGIFRPEIWSKTTSRVINGTGASAFDDAVQGLHNLARRHGVQGISLAENPNQYGGIMLRGDIGYSSGNPILRHLGHGDEAVGREVAFRLDAAARRVLDFVDVPAGR